ncbi:hypothetical protein I79_008308 [Cricetulus griseus]|uniref:Uncharacterized protein n=1 Tax=Cricetulus griseus TaxID=10029 RepID=G3HCU1_CRIGR|nr:hypothetical protein I79_008308 [Cricetulus griseus]
MSLESCAAATVHQLDHTLKAPSRVPAATRGLATSAHMARCRKARGSLLQAARTP